MVASIFEDADFFILSQTSPEFVPCGQIDSKSAVVTTISQKTYQLTKIMMTSSKGNIFRLTGPLCGEFTGDRWIPAQVTRSFDVFSVLNLNKRLSKQSSVSFRFVLVSPDMTVTVSQITDNSRLTEKKHQWPFMGESTGDLWLHARNQSRRRHQMETFSALLALCAGNSPVIGEFPAQRPVTRSFDVFFVLSLNKRLSKQPWDYWFETTSLPLWRPSNDPAL